jgi:hypothetical protein
MALPEWRVPQRRKILFTATKRSNLAPRETVVALKGLRRILIAKVVACFRP